MKNVKTIVAKALSLALAIGILGNSLPVQEANAATVNATQKIEKQSNISENVLYEDSTYKITENNNIRTVLNKDTLQTVTLKFTDSKKSKGKFKDVDGKLRDYSTDSNGSMYLDGDMVVEATQSVVKANNNLAVQAAGYTNPRYFIGKDGLTYYYVTTYKTNTKTQGEINSIVMTILALIPYAGASILIVGVIETCKELGKPIVYIQQDQYCVSNYQKYAYKTYYYKNSDYTGLIDSATVYKQMW